MKRFLRRAMAAALAAAMALPLAGCWDYREVESLQFVAGIAIDKGSSKRYGVTLELVDLAGGAQGSSNLPGKLVEADGDTVADAVANVATDMEGDLYFNDCKIAVFSRDIAKDGLTPALDWLNRDPQPRFTIQLYVSLEQRAADVLKPESEDSPAVAPYIASAMEQANTMGRNTQVCLYEADNILLGEGMDLSLPCLKREKLPDGQSGGQSGGQSNSQPGGQAGGQASGQASGQSKTVISGTAVFRGDRLVGYRSEDQTRTDMLFTSSVHEGQFVVEAGSAAKRVSLTIRNSSSSILPAAGPRISISIDADCTLDEENTSANVLLSLGTDGVERLAQSTLCANAQKEIRAVQTELGCDIFGFGREISRKDPELWKKLKPRWGEIFRTLKVDVSARVHIDNSGYAYPKGKR